jgi:gas vesicle protein
MVNHNYEHENDAREPGSLWARLLAALLAALLIGGLVGAGVMLLLAPQSGKKTRAKLQRQSHKLREQTAEIMEDAMAQASVTARQITHDVRKQAEELEQRGQAMLDGQKGR